ncbi:unnamed protein product [Arabidopsis arenosa]|uniref:Uncharacterized protein n=1 Tax=Arabidopsis arenosa TaxID=38785 RepID=A0A8S1ZFU5_ARAAE|nr:unnamed protein product [Arabidopsis arenosa]
MINQLVTSCRLFSSVFEYNDNNKQKKRKSASPSKKSASKSRSASPPATTAASPPASTAAPPPTSSDSPPVSVSTTGSKSIVLPNAQSTVLTTDLAIATAPPSDLKSVPSLALADVSKAVTTIAVSNPPALGADSEPSDSTPQSHKSVEKTQIETQAENLKASNQTTDDSSTVHPAESCPRLKTSETKHRRQRKQPHYGRASNVDAVKDSKMVYVRVSPKYVPVKEAAREVTSQPQLNHSLQKGEASGLSVQSKAGDSKDSDEKSSAPSSEAEPDSSDTVLSVPASVL